MSLGPLQAIHMTNLGLCRPIPRRGASRYQVLACPLLLRSVLSVPAALPLFLPNLKRPSTLEYAPLHVTVS